MSGPAPRVRVPPRVSSTLLVALLLTSPALAQTQEPEAAADRAPAPGPSGGALLPEQAALDVQHYRLTLTVDPEARRIDGELVLTAVVVAPVSRLVLHLDGHLDVVSVDVAGRPLAFRHADGLLTAELPAPASVGSRLVAAVRYGGQPRVAPRPPWDGGFTWDQTADGRPWIATSCQGSGADLWWPCKDHPSDKPETMDLAITVPADLVCASNGTLRSDTANPDGTRTFRWHIASPISNYAVALNIAPYEVLRREHHAPAGSYPVVFYVLPENRAAGTAFLDQIEEHLAFFEDVVGPYPFRAEKYGVVETPHLGMEHQTIIAYGNQYRTGRFSNYDWLHHHELSHEWWGNLVTCRDWKDMWIHEGIGTYMQALFLERKHGRDAYLSEMAAKKRFSLVKPVAPREPQDSHQIYFKPGGGFDSDIYNKGSWVMHTLRWLLGDEDFFELIRRMAYPTPAHLAALDGSQVRLVDTADFIALAEEVSGRELDWFFDVYLRQPALPELVSERTETGLHLSWSVAGDRPFPMPVPLEVGEETRRVAMDEGQAEIPLPDGAVAVIDPDDLVLRSEAP